MAAGTFSGWLFASLLLSLRIAPVFALAPPFTLVRVPMLFRVLFGTGIAASIASYNPSAAVALEFTPGNVIPAAIRELFLGSVFVLAFQAAFGALYMAGRTVDIQAGYGLALLIDPATRGQAPLVGTIYAYAAGAIFFAMDGHHDLLRILAASLETVPLGSAAVLPPIERLLGFLSLAFLISLGVAGGAILALFLTDVAIAVLARTAPQMNALVLGFQVKTLVLLFALPATLGFAAAMIARLIALTFEAIPGLVR